MPRTVDKEEKARSIGRAALKVFREKGYHPTRMSDIAKAAGVGKGTVYEYFRNKLQILQFVLDEYFTAFKEGALLTISSAKTPAEKLIALVEFSFDHIAEWEDHCAAFVDYFSLARTGEEQNVTLDAMIDDMREMLRILIEQCQTTGEISSEIEPLAAAELLLSLFDGIVLQGVITTRSCDATALRKAAMELLTNGLIKGSGQYPTAGPHNMGGGKCSATCS